MTESSAFAEDDQASSEMLDLIKARTMYQMVEEIDGGARKLLFLSNVQAEQIAQRPESLQKMLDALEVGRPQLLIDLITSGGFREYTSRPKNTQGVLDDGFMGLLAGGPPLPSRGSRRLKRRSTRSWPTSSSHSR